METMPNEPQQTEDERSLAAAQETVARIYAQIDERAAAVSGSRRYLDELQQRLHPEVQLPSDDN